LANTSIAKFIQPLITRLCGASFGGEEKKAKLLELKYRIKKVPRLFVKTGNSMNNTGENGLVVVRTCLGSEFIACGLIRNCYFQQIVINCTHP
jgi:hypothetical protein